MALNVNLNGCWRIYANTMPPYFVPVGVVQRETGERGVLVYIKTSGLYAQYNAGVLRGLPQDEVVAALEVARNG